MEPQPQRLYYIDWLRLIAVFLLFTYHTARIFDPWENFYAYNDTVSPPLAYIFIWTVGPWHMNLFFLLAGASTYFALRRRSGRQYVKERFKRLFIPFVFGVLVLIPPQSYLGFRNHSNYSESFLSWFPNFFTLHTDDMDGYFMGGHTWGHLWFIIHLFVYSLIAVSLFLYLNRESGRRRISRLAGFFTRPGILFLVPILLVILFEFPEVAGGNPLFYIAFFIFGFVLMSDSRFMNTIDKWRAILFIMGPLMYAFLIIMNTTDSWPAATPQWVFEVFNHYIDSFVPWFVILTMLAYGRRFLNFTNRFLKYFAEGAYALYILHQTIIVIVGYYVVQWHMTPAVKFTIIVALAVTSTVLTYDILVKRTSITRFLFGMKPSPVRSKIDKNAGQTVSRSTGSQ